MKDLYGRIIRTKAQFYYKGLPTGTLTIENGGITNKSVFFYYDNTLYTAKMFMTTKYDARDDRKELTPSVDYRDYKIATGKQEMGIVNPTCDLTHYVIQLVDKKNKNQFAEWNFRIDTVLSPTLVADENGTELIKNSVTNKNFRFIAKDPELKLKISYNGSGINPQKAKEMLFDKEGIYKFKVSDLAGNYTEYTMEIDKTVKFRVHNAKKIDDTHWISNKPVSIVDDEIYKLSGYIVEGKEMTIKDQFIFDGEYKVTLIDAVGNIKTIHITIDTRKPDITVSEKKTKGNITVTFSDNERVELYRNNTLLEGKIESGAVIEEAGKYRLVVWDKAGNQASETFEIKRHIIANLSVPNGAVTSDSVSFSQGEKMSVKVFNGSDEVDVKTRYTQPGKYTIKMIDTLGNEGSFTFEIIRTKMRTFELKLSEGHSVVTVMKNKEFIPATTNFNSDGKYEVVCSAPDGKRYNLNFELNTVKPKVAFKKHQTVYKVLRGDKKKITARLYKNGTLLEKNYSFKPITDSGKYMLEVEDEFGNKTVIKGKFVKPLNTQGIVAIVVSSILLCVVIGLIIFFSVRKKKIA